jgi:hypothetical protein
VDREVTDSRQANRLLSEENAVMEMIASNQPLEDILGQICTMIESQLTGGRCSVMLLTEDGQHLHVASGNKLPAGYLDIIEGIAIGPEVGSCGTAAYFKRTIIVEDMENSPLWQPYLELTAPSGCAPAGPHRYLAASASYWAPLPFTTTKPARPTPMKCAWSTAARISPPLPCSATSMKKAGPAGHHGRADPAGQPSQFPAASCARTQTQPAHQRHGGADDGSGSLQEHQRPMAMRRAMK